MSLESRYNRIKCVVSCQSYQVIELKFRLVLDLIAYQLVLSRGLRTNNNVTLRHPKN